MVRSLKSSSDSEPCRFPLAGIVLTAVLLASVGCNSNPPTYPVQGTVEFANGRPVVVGVVECFSEEYKLNARGDIGPDGSFSLTTFSPDDGAVAGEHRCVVVQMVIGENINGHRPSTIGVVAPKYADYSTSGLTMVVSPDSPNEVTLVVRGIEKQPAPGAPHKH
ncbi:MAG TPA: carboxypeptidase regulatory-like domain-containing protein [Planctomycetaceae bacterium]|nr:carboxypeptidase regulatory-like domain-containing protein [Planctomycetaceae bacterium]